MAAKAACARAGGLPRVSAPAIVASRACVPPCGAPAKRTFLASPGSEKRADLGEIDVAVEAGVGTWIGASLGLGTAGGSVRGQGVAPGAGRAGSAIA